MLNSFSQSLQNCIQESSHEAFSVNELFSLEERSSYKNKQPLATLLHSEESNFYQVNSKNSKHNYQKQKRNNNQTPPQSEHYYYEHHSEKIINYESVKSVRGKQPSEVSKSLSIRSSQFSQKDNNEDIKLHKYKGNELSKKKVNDSKDSQASDQYIYFENVSLSNDHFRNSEGSALSKSDLLAGGKNKQEMQMHMNQINKGNISFVDSINSNHFKSESQITQYGTAKNAKIPDTVKKPKFSFKCADTSASSVEKIELQDEQRSIKNKKSNKEHFSGEGILDDYQMYVQKDDRLKKSNIIQFASSSSKGSIIKEISNKPSLNSKKSLSLSNESKVPSQFGSVFKKKVEKASVLNISKRNSSISVKQFKHIYYDKENPKMQIADLKKLHELQNEVGKLKHQTFEYNKILSQKQKQIKRLQVEKNKRELNDEYYLKKQNQLLNVICQHQNIKNNDKLLNLAVSRQTSSNIKLNKNRNLLESYDQQVHKLKLSNLKGYDHQYKKHIINNRGVLLQNDILEIGYNYKSKEITLYITLHRVLEEIDIQLQENGVLCQDRIERNLQKIYIGKQMKFKTKVIGTKYLKNLITSQNKSKKQKGVSRQNQFIPNQLIVKVTYEKKFKEQKEEFVCKLPLTPYNIAIPVAFNEEFPFAHADNKSVPFKTQLYSSCEELIKKKEHFLTKMFPLGLYLPESDSFVFHLEWKQRIQIFLLKLKEKSFILEGRGFPDENGKEIIESIIRLLIQNQ